MSVLRYCCWLLLIIADYCWLLLIIADYCWLLLIIADCCWLLLIIADYCWLLLIIADYCWLLLIILDVFSGRNVLVDWFMLFVIYHTVCNWISSQVSVLLVGPLFPSSWFSGVYVCISWLCIFFKPYDMETFTTQRPFPLQVARSTFRCSPRT